VVLVIQEETGLFQRCCHMTYSHSVVVRDDGYIWASHPVGQTYQIGVVDRQCLSPPCLHYFFARVRTE
jgi:hypothetical protein